MYLHSLICHSGKIGTEGDLSVKLEGEEETESSEGEDQETQMKLVEEISQSAIFSIFPNAVELYQKKTGIVLVWQSRPSCEGFAKGSQQGWQKSEFKCKRGDDEKGRLEPSDTSSWSPGIPGWGPQSLMTP